MCIRDRPATVHSIKCLSKVIESCVGMYVGKWYSTCFSVIRAVVKKQSKHYLPWNHPSPPRKIVSVIGFSWFARINCTVYKTCWACWHLYSYHISPVVIYDLFMFIYDAPYHDNPKMLSLNFCNFFSPSMVGSFVSCK